MFRSHWTTPQEDVLFASMCGNIHELGTLLEPPLDRKGGVCGSIHHHLHPSLSAVDVMNTKVSIELAPMHVAAMMGHYGIVSYLIRKGAVVNIRDRELRTPLHWACKYGHKDIVELLLCKDAQVQIPDHVGSTPMHYACYGGSVEIVGMLILAMEDRHHHGVGGCPSLSSSSRNSNINHSVLNACDHQGRTPLDVAKHMERSTIVDFLETATSSSASTTATARTKTRTSPPPTTNQQRKRKFFDGMMEVVPGAEALQQSSSSQIHDAPRAQTATATPAIINHYRQKEENEEKTFLDSTNSNPSRSSATSCNHQTTNTKHQLDVVESMMTLASVAVEDPNNRNEERFENADFLRKESSTPPSTSSSSSIKKRVMRNAALMATMVSSSSSSSSSPSPMSSSIIPAQQQQQQLRNNSNNLTNASSSSPTSPLPPVPSESVMIAPARSNTDASVIVASSKTKTSTTTTSTMGGGDGGVGVGGVDVMITPTTTTASTEPDEYVRGEDIPADGTSYIFTTKQTWHLPQNKGLSDFMKGFCRYKIQHDEEQQHQHQLQQQRQQQGGGGGGHCVGNNSNGEGSNARVKCQQHTTAFYDYALRAGKKLYCLRRLSNGKRPRVTQKDWHCHTFVQVKRHEANDVLKSPMGTILKIVRGEVDDDITTRNITATSPTHGSNSNMQPKIESDVTAAAAASSRLQVVTGGSSTNHPQQQQNHHRERGFVSAMKDKKSCSSTSMEIRSSSNHHQVVAGGGRVMEQQVVLGGGSKQHQAVCSSPSSLVERAISQHLNNKNNIVNNSSIHHQQHHVMQDAPFSSSLHGGGGGGNAMIPTTMEGSGGGGIIKSMSMLRRPQARHASSWIQPQHQQQPPPSSSMAGGLGITATSSIMNQRQRYVPSAITPFERQRVVDMEKQRLPHQQQHLTFYAAAGVGGASTAQGPSAAKAMKTTRNSINTSRDSDGGGGTVGTQTAVVNQNDTSNYGMEGGDESSSSIGTVAGMKSPNPSSEKSSKGATGLDLLAICSQAIS